MLFRKVILNIMIKIDIYLSGSYSQTSVLKFIGTNKFQSHVEVKKAVALLHLILCSGYIYINIALDFHLKSITLVWLTPTLIIKTVPNTGISIVLYHYHHFSVVLESVKYVIQIASYSFFNHVHYNNGLIFCLPMDWYQHLYL